MAIRKRMGKRPAHSVIPSTAEIRKIVGAGNRFGNPGLKNQQLTTFEIFHYLNVPNFSAKNSLKFFQNVNTAQFPFANIQENRLQVGETMVINRVWFTIMLVKSGVVQSVTSFDQYTGGNGLYSSQMTWLNDNNRVIKNMSLTEMQPNFNRKGFNVLNNVIHLETDITVQPLIRFVCELDVAPCIATASEDLYIGCHAAGVGTLLAPKTTY